MGWDQIFMWVGVAVCTVAALAAFLLILLIIYARLVFGRFECALGKTNRRMSLASWHRSRLIGADFEADDFPIRRPYYLSYRISPDRRLFLMVAILDGRRSSAMRGRHPNEVAE